ncbi:MAG TPA: DEAD/DEAH box helicase [Burkholderiales bacterium]|nr:DEAD/DEAH box helicase [Burkholderiales bacterium]
MTTAALLHVSPADLARGRPYPERDEREPPWHDRVAAWLWHETIVPLTSPVKDADRREASRFVALVNSHAAGLASADDTQLRTQMNELRAELRRAGFDVAPAARCFALVREAASRVLGQRHFDTQVLAGWWLLRGTLVEMATGEGKTFAATLPACAAALAGAPVHVITVNDYLAERDAEAMGPLYRFFGLECAAIVHGLTRQQRRAAYAAHVAYASNKELAFDYLRDRVALGDRASPLHLAVEGLRAARRRDEQVVLRGLAYAIVDEADSVFIDEARTPLILSTVVDGQYRRETCEAALAFARTLVRDRHFSLDLGQHRVLLTDTGRDELDRREEEAGREAVGMFASSRERDEYVQRALVALWLYERDKHYVLIDGKVQIVDGSTGRIMPDRSWERGLHQMIETKEGAALTGQHETLARITYQRLFRRYLRLSGMTGTATEVAAEIGRTYGLRVARVPLHKPSRRSAGAVRCFRTQREKWQAVAEAAARVAIEQQRPVLIGTRTVSASEQVSEMLRVRGLAHVVLNAKQDREEASIIGSAGLPGRITVATNMAGRGTDIRLAPDVAERGGLHVILTEFNESPRVDRQLFGRSARQGDPGSCECIVALDDDLFVAQAPALTRWLAQRAGTGIALSRLEIAVLRRVAQRRAERRNREARESALKLDRRLAQVLAFSGRGE